MSNARQGWYGIGILSLTLVVLLILQMASPYLGWSDPDVEEGFVIDEVVNGLGGPACLEWSQRVIYLFATEMEVSSDC